MAEQAKEKQAVKFDVLEFDRINYSSRTKELLLPAFGGNEETVTWTIRNLTSADLADVEDALQKNKDLLAMVETVIEAVSDSQYAKSKKEAIQKIAGINESVSNTLLRQYVVFEKGSVEPEFSSRHLTIKFAKVYPHEFKRIVNEIYLLTHQGGYAKKKPFSCGGERTSDKT